MFLCPDTCFCLDMSSVDGKNLSRMRSPASQVEGNLSGNTEALQPFKYQENMQTPLQGPDIMGQLNKGVNCPCFIWETQTLLGNVAVNWLFCPL